MDIEHPTDPNHPINLTPPDPWHPDTQSMSSGDWERYLAECDDGDTNSDSIARAEHYADLGELYAIVNDRDKFAAVACEQVWKYCKKRFKEAFDCDYEPGCTCERCK